MEKDDLFSENNQQRDSQNYVNRNTFVRSNYDANLSDQADGAQTNFKSI